MSRTPSEIINDLLGFIAPSYPNIDIRAEPWEHDPNRLAVYFTDEKFSLIYPYQRWHYLTHLIPADYQDEHLSTSVWFELAPGESPADLRYPDEELIADITPDVMRILMRIGFFKRLDDVMCPVEVGKTAGQCWGDFRNAVPILHKCGITEDELFDVLHVLMFQGGFCDCEILYNAVEESRLKAGYWKARAAGLEPPNPHKGA